MSHIAIKHSASAGGDGQPTAKDLKEVLAVIPESTIVRITYRSDQRDGDSWSLSAEWDSEAEKTRPQGVVYPPGVRSTMPDMHEGVGGYGSQLR